MWEVSEGAYGTCDKSSYIAEWAPRREGGSIHVWLKSGVTHYFIDPVSDNCLDGIKIKVSTHTDAILISFYSTSHNY